MTQTIRIQLPNDRFVLIVNQAGCFIGNNTQSDPTQTELSDDVLWRVVDDKHLENAVDKSRHLLADDEVAWPGPHRLLSQLDSEFQEHGWVCLPEILSTETVQALQKISGIHDDSPPGTRFGALLEDVAVARTICEPVSAWLTRRYLGTPHVRLAHTPTIAITVKDDGVSDVQGWHSDYPYLWGITESVPQAPAEMVLGVQRNVCVTDFTEDNGATIFVLGSHKNNCAPPEAWGTQTQYGKPGYRAKYGLPHAGSECQVIEAPAGSIILYDARTWHRQGINRTDHKRAAMLQAMTPGFVGPFYDTAGEYKALRKQGFYEQLNIREQIELSRLLVHTMYGRGGQVGLGADQELTELLLTPTQTQE